MRATYQRGRGRAQEKLFSSKALPCGAISRLRSIARLQQYGCVIFYHACMGVFSSARGKRYPVRYRNHTCIRTAYHSSIALVYMYGHTYSKSSDQPGKVANPARGQLNREDEYFPARVRTREFGLARRVRQSRPASGCSSPYSG